MSQLRRLPPFVFGLLLEAACAPHGPDESVRKDAPVRVEPPPPPTVEVDPPPPIDPMPSVGPVPAGAASRCFATVVDHLLPFAPFDGELGDVDGDGDLDLVVIGWPGEGVVTMGNDGKGGFFELAQPRSEPEALDLVLVDADGDRVLDLVTTHPQSGEVHVRRGDGLGNFAAGTVIALGRQVFQVMGADLDADGANDLVVTQLRHVAALRGNGRGEFVDRPRVRVGQAPSYPFVADVDRDGRRELVLASNDDGGVDVVPIAGMKLGSPRHAACGQGPIAIGMGDFDGDARLDLVTANMHSHDVCVFGGRSDGFVRRQIIDREFDALAVSDFDGDGKDDVAFAKDLAVTLFAADDTELIERESIAAGHGANYAWARDVDGDGVEDLVLLNGHHMRFTYGDDGTKRPLDPTDASFTVLHKSDCPRLEPGQR